MTFNRRNDRNVERETSEFEEKMLFVNRTSKTYQGGRRFRFAALVILGDAIVRCRWPWETARRRSRDLPVGGQENCPLVAMRSAHFLFGTPPGYAAGASSRGLIAVSRRTKVTQEEVL